MRNRRNNYIVLMLGMMMLMFVQCASLDIGQKPVLTMQDVKSLGPVDLADFAISLYNKQADYYRDQMSRVETLNLEQRKQLVKDYKMLTEVWPIIDIYDKLVAAKQPVDGSTRIQLYRFVEKYLTGGE